MSLIVATYVPEGVIMASDSRQSITISGKTKDGTDFKVETTNSDSVTKTFLLERQRVGISNFGDDLLGGMPMASHIKRFSEEVLEEGDDVTTISRKLLDFFSNEFPGANSGFHICGYRKDGKVSVPYVYFAQIKQKILQRKNCKEDEKLTYGSAWAGQADVISNLIKPSGPSSASGDENEKSQAPFRTAPIIWDAMTLQDAADFSVFAIRTTIETIRFQARQKNVGGPVDVLVITPDKAEFIARKGLTV